MVNLDSIEIYDITHYKIVGKFMIEWTFLEFGQNFFFFWAFKDQVIPSHDLFGSLVT